MRWLIAVGTLLLIAVAVAFWLLAPPAPLSAHFVAGDCRRVALIDADTGWRIAGAEAIVEGPLGRIFLAAHDRGRADGPGGLYVIEPLLLTGTPELSLATLYPAATGTFRPHGLAISAYGMRLATINRYAPRAARVEIGALSANRWQPDRQIEGPGICRANGLGFEGLATDDLLITLDRADCATSLRDLMPGATTGRLAQVDSTGYTIVREGLSFPNGVMGPFIAETRAGRISGPGGAEIMTPGGPDNLSLADDGRIVAAVHPRLHLLGLYLGGWTSSAPSRIVAADPGSGTVEVLFDDPDGVLFSGATGALLIDDMLIAGSVRDEGLLVCRKGGA